MRKNSLSPNGLSLSQAQSISNLCNQRAVEIDNKLNGVNNFSKSVRVNGDTLVTVVAKPLPMNVVSLLIEKAQLFACQGFLMENIKAKDNLIKAAQADFADVTSIEFPTSPLPIRAETLSKVTEEWGWEQLTPAEMCTFLEAEAYAAHIGQFIHNRGVLDTLRKELPGINPIEWMSIKEGEKIPVTVKTHHSSDTLLAVHEKLASLHREHEQQVNYFKAKVKNLTTLENARIAKFNADAQNDVQQINLLSNKEYMAQYNACSDAVRKIQADFEKARQENIKLIASLRISVDSRFQPVVDMFLKALPTE